MCVIGLGERQSILRDGVQHRPQVERSCHAQTHLLQGRQFGDTLAGLPNSQLAVLPGTSHVTLVDRVDWVVTMIDAFLDAPVKSE